MKKFSLLISTVILLSLLSACASKKSAPNTTSDANMVATIVAGTLSAIPTVTLTPVPSATIQPIPTNTVVVDDWAWYTIDLYNLKLKLPNGWTVSEVNRRPEPLGAGISPEGHDCAEYNISNSDGTIKLSLKPYCGFWESNPAKCSNDVVFMSRHSDAIVRYYNEDGLIGRYYDSSKSAYIYEEVGFPIWEKEIVLACYSSPGIAVLKEKDFDFIYAEFQFLGTETNIDHTLNMVDEIVLSISNK